jgi:hypothetical protein
MSGNYVFQHTGSRFYNWRHGAPRGFRAGETRELSGFGDSPVIRPGEPEPLTGLGSVGSGMSLLAVLAGLGAIFWLGSAVMGKTRSYKKNPGKRKRRKTRRKRRAPYSRRVRMRHAATYLRRPIEGHVVADEDWPTGP